MLEEKRQSVRVAGERRRIRRWFAEDCWQPPILFGHSRAFDRMVKQRWKRSKDVVRGRQWVKSNSMREYTFEREGQLRKRESEKLAISSQGSTCGWRRAVRERVRRQSPFGDRHLFFKMKMMKMMEKKMKKMKWPFAQSWHQIVKRNLVWGADIRTDHPKQISFNWFVPLPLPFNVITFNQNLISRRRWWWVRHVRSSGQLVRRAGLQKGGIWFWNWTTCFSIDAELPKKKSINENVSPDVIKIKSILFYLFWIKIAINYTF